MERVRVRVRFECMVTAKGASFPRPSPLSAGGEGEIRASHERLSGIKCIAPDRILGRSSGFHPGVARAKIACERKNSVHYQCKRAPTNPTHDRSPTWNDPWSGRK